MFPYVPTDAVLWCVLKWFVWNGTGTCWPVVSSCIPQPGPPFPNHTKQGTTNQPAKQQTKQRETQQSTKQKSPKFTSSIPVVWMPFEVMTIVILLTTCSAIPITTFGQTLFRVSSLLLFTLLVFNFKSFSSNVSNWNRSPTKKSFWHGNLPEILYVNFLFGELIYISL